MTSAPKYLVIDCETIKRPVPLQIGIDKKEKLQKKYARGTFEEWEENSWCFQPGGSQVIALGAYSPDTMEGKVFCDADEKKVIRGFAQMWEDGGFTKLVGFNLKAFDMCQIMVNLECLSDARKLDHSSFIDLMKQPFGYDAGMYSLNYYLEIFGLPLKEGKGSDVAENWKLDQADGGTRVKDYCEDDVKKTCMLFNRYREFYNFK